MLNSILTKNKFYLQMFADDGGNGSDDGGDGKTPKDNQPPNNSPDNKDPKNGDDYNTPKYSDADFDRLFNKKFAELSQKKDKEIKDAQKLAQMDATQKAEYERDKLQKELDELKKKDTLAEMSKTARKILSDNNINISDDLLSLMVTTDAEETKTAIDSFASLFKDAVESAVKERLKGEPPKKGTRGGNASMTKAEIMAIKDPELRQQKMLENKHLFNFN